MNAALGFVKLLNPLLEIKTYLYGLLIFSLSCSDLKNKTDNNNSQTKVLTSVYSYSDSIEHKIELSLDKIIDDEKTKYLYREIGLPDSLLNYSVIHDTKNDGLTFFNDSCSFLSYKICSVGDKSYKILKYSNNSNIADGDTDFYFVNDYGLIAIRSVDWRNYYTFDNGLKSDSIVISKLINDSTGFFKTILPL